MVQASPRSNELIGVLRYFRFHGRAIILRAPVAALHDLVAGCSREHRAHKIRVQPIIGIHEADIPPRSVLQAEVPRYGLTCVLLREHPNLPVRVRAVVICKQPDDRLAVVCAAVIHEDDLQRGLRILVNQRIDALRQVVSGIIYRHDHRHLRSDSFADQLLELRDLVLACEANALTCSTVVATQPAFVSRITCAKHSSSERTHSTGFSTPNAS